MAPHRKAVRRLCTQFVESVSSGYCSAEQGVIAMSSSVYFNQTSPVVRSADYTAKIVATFKTKLAPFHYIAFSGITRFHCIAAKKYLPDPAVMTSIQAQSWALQHACIHISHAGGMPGSLVINGGPPLTRVWLLPKLNRDWNGYHWHHKIRRNISMMTSSNGNIFRVTGHLCREFTGGRWIPRTKASGAELWCFLWSVSK